jgi:hypothetical protein
MNIAIFDPGRSHQYLSDMFFDPMKLYMHKTMKRPVITTESLPQTHNAIVLTLADHLNLEVVNQLKNNNCKIVGFSVTDSSYISQSCREAAVLSKIDLMFMLTGIQKVNEGHEMVIDENFNIKLEKRQFLPEEDWTAFNMMRLSGRLQSLPYVHWTDQPNVTTKPYNERSQKALIRGGHHMRRFILALKLMNIDRLDINSGFITSPYFQDSMNKQFRYCDECREIWREHKKYPYNKNVKCSCRVPPLSDLGQWNNASPSLFYGFAEDFGVPDSSMHLVERMMNANWLTQQQHLEMLARITFTADLKWLFSIYAAQRFWDAAMVGCVNLLPERTRDQEYFPNMYEHAHYITFKEDLECLGPESELNEKHYNEISSAAKALYDQWLRPTDYAINSNLLRHIFSKITAL